MLPRKHKILRNHNNKVGAGVPDMDARVSVSGLMWTQDSEGETRKGLFEKALKICGSLTAYRCRRLCEEKNAKVPYP